MQTDDRIQEILAQASQATAGGKSEGGEDAFDANEYVRDLIARMGSEQKPASVESPAPATEEVSVSKEETVEQRIAQSLDLALSTEDPEEPQAGYDPLSHPPRSQSALPVDMEQLREAANITSSCALLRSGKSDIMKSCSLNYILAASSISISMVLVSLSPGRYSTAYFASIGMALIACYSTFRYYSNSKLLARFDETSPPPTTNKQMPQQPVELEDIPTDQTQPIPTDI